MLDKYYFLSCKVIFEPPGGATPEALHYFVGKICDIPLEKLNVAKYLRAKYEWLVIKDTDGTQVNSLFKFKFPVLQILQRPLCHNCTKRHIAITVSNTKNMKKPSQRHSCTKVFYHAIVVFSGNPCQVLNLQYLFHSFSTEQEKGSEKENQFATVSCLSSRWRCYWCQGNVIVLVTLKSSSSFWGSAVILPWSL